MAELVDALDSGSSRGNLVDVRVILAAVFQSHTDKAILMTLKLRETKSAAIIANGSFRHAKEFENRVKEFSFLIAADGGLAYCSQMGVAPDLIIGDMDSAPSSLLDQYPQAEKRTFPPEKDKTDVEIAVEAAIELGMEKVVIFGALEKRIDHSLYNLHLLARFPDILSIESDYETAFVIREPKEIACFPGQTVSLIPLGTPATGVSTKGLKWELDRARLDSGFMSLSNVCLKNSFYVDLENGALLCCLCKTLKR